MNIHGAYEITLNEELLVITLTFDSDQLNKSIKLYDDYYEVSDSWKEELSAFIILLTERVNARFVYVERDRELNREECSLNVEYEGDNSRIVIKEGEERLVIKTTSGLIPALENVLNNIPNPPE